MLEDLFFTGWKPILHTVIVAIIAYPTMLVVVRLSGHRTLSKMNAFDLVVTVALGSTLSSAILSPDVSLAQGVLGFTLLVLLQLAFSWMTKRSRRVESLVNGDPVLLYHRGSFLRDAMRAQRVTDDEILAAMRSSGVASRARVLAVVLETNGQLSVVEGDAPREAPDQALSTRPTLSVNA